MGRRRTVNLTLPEGMRARTWSSGRTYFYLEAGGGSDQAEDAGDNQQQVQHGVAVENESAHLLINSVLRSLPALVPSQ